MSDFELYKNSMQTARRELIEDLSQRDFIVFAGAGISEPTGIPLWKGLLKALEKEQPLAGVEIDKVEEYQCPNIAQMLYLEFDKKNKIPDYHKIIQDKMQSTKLPHTPLQEEIILASNGKIATTNYDNTFESAFQKLKRRQLIQSDYTFQTLSNLNCEKSRLKNNITYLHGKFDETEIIFKTADYEKYYPSHSNRQKSSLEKFLKYIYLESGLAIIFVGFSFEDPYVIKTLERNYAEIKMNNPKILENVKHYALLESKVEENDINLSEPKKMLLEKMAKENKRLNEINITVFRYEYAQHKQLDDLFEGISQKLDTFKALTKPEDHVAS
ncbi:MAG: SIR2 family protein [Candidatus Delongbacteria bacterium]|nr:SIR2 family protein [Candidatus Delongbacteria bacterium]